MTYFFKPKFFILISDQKFNMNSQVSSSEGCSCDDVTDAGNPIELTLDNFDNDEIPDDCPFVLTSPRSLEACKVVGVRVSKENFLFHKEKKNILIISV